MGDAVVNGLSGFPPRGSAGASTGRSGPWRSTCAVASGVLDGYIDCSRNAHGVWDFLAGMLICQEAGAHVVDAFSRELGSARPP